MSSPDVSINRADVKFEASPDVEVTMVIFRGETKLAEVDSNVNISKTVAQLKGVIAKHFSMEADRIEIWKGTTLLTNDKKLLEFDVKPDDVLHVKHPTDD